MILKWIWRLLQTYQAIIWLSLLGIATVVAQGIAESVANIVVSKMVVMILLALLFGAAFAVAKLPAWLGITSIVSLGIEYLLLFWANLRWPMGGVIAALGNTLLPAGGQPGNQPDWTRLQVRFWELNQALQVLIIRIINWATKLGNSSVVDPLVPQLAWGLVTWLSVAFLAWSIWQNRQVIMAVFPAGLLLALAAFFSGDLYEELTFFLLCTIVLQASSQGFKRLSRWKAKQIDYADDLSLDLAVAVIPLAIGIITLAFYAPTISISKIAQTIADLSPWNTEQAEAVVSSFGLKSPPNPLRQAGLTGLPRSHLLGDSPDLGQQLVMTIQTGELPPMPDAAEDTVDVPGHYWQSATYDRYNSAGWIFAAAGAVTVDPNALINDPLGPGRLVEQRVRREKYATNLLHTSGIPLTVDQPLEANYRAGDDLAVATLDSDLYSATSWIIDNTPGHLRGAGTGYPEAIARTYLKLPKSLPDRVRNLALDLTVTEPTPYDKAIAIESYLRQFPYNLQIEKPPAGVDVADYFLFELQEGYCDYYATSMTVLARAAGLPARFVIGYVTGHYDVEEALYRVSEAEAHSWVQIYFPDIGWVNFEPTAGRPAIDRELEPTSPAGNLERFEDFIPENSAIAAADLPSGNLANLLPVHPFWLGLLALILIFIITSVDYWRLRLLKPQALSDTLYHRLVTRAAQVGMTTQASDTPYEFAAKFTGYIKQEIPRSRLARFRVQAFWRPAIHPGDEPTFRGIQQVAQVFVRQKYAPPEGFTLDRDRLLIIWGELNAELSRAARVLRLTRRYPGLFSKHNGFIQARKDFDKQTN